MGVAWTISLEFCLPELFPCLRIKGPESSISRAGDKDQSARRDNCPTQILRAGIVDSPGFKLFYYSKRHSPNNLTLSQINSTDCAPGWLLTRSAVLITKPR